MAPPVWVLSVDLQTKTATFQSGMADAAKSARGAFNEIKSGSSEMGHSIGQGAFASRHAVMALSEAFGETMPRAITALLVHIGPLGAALEAAFPFAAIALGAVLLIQHLEKLKAEGIKLTEDQVKFGTAVQTAFNVLDDRLIQSQIKADELRNDHLGALHLQLKLIDNQSMAELVHSFGEVAKAADVVFADLKTGWYQFGAGSAGAKHALDEFQTKYDSLLAQGKEKEASDLLKGTRESAQKILDQQQAAKKPIDNGGDFSAEVAKEMAVVDLRKERIGYSDKEVEAQQALVSALDAQVSLEGKVAALKSQDKGNATTSTGKEMSALAATAAKEAAEHSRKMGEIQLQIERETTEASLSVKEATIAERLAADVHLADAEYKVAVAGNAALIGALDKGGKDYNNQLRGLQDKALELTAQHSVTLAGLTTKATIAQYRQDIENLEAGEREKIEATERGSRERIAAIDASLKEEAAKGRVETAMYRDLLKQKVQAQREAAAESAVLAAEAGKQEAENTAKMGELTLAAERQRQQLEDSARRVTIQQRIAEETKAANQESAIKMAALQSEAAALDKAGKDYENKLKAIQDKERQLVQAHENELTAIKSKAEIDRNQRILSAENQFNNSIASGLSEVIMGHKSFAAMMDSIGSQVVSGMIQNAIKSILANDMTKESDAAKAARKAFNIGLDFPFPVNVVMGPLMGAAAFASVMAFESGTDRVPGMGTRDTVPAMLTPGEGVVPGGVMDGLRAMARSGSMGGGNHYHAHVAPVYHVQALDASGLQKVLDKHSTTLTRHVTSTLRKMNK